MLFTISLYIPMQIVHQKYCVVVWFSSINHCQFYSIVSIIFNYNYPISCTVTFTETSAACKQMRFQNSFSFYHSLSIISSKWKDIKNIEVRFCRAIEILKSHMKYLSLNTYSNITFLSFVTYFRLDIIWLALIVFFFISAEWKLLSSSRYFLRYLNHIKQQMVSLVLLVSLASIDLMSRQFCHITLCSFSQLLWYSIEISQFLLKHLLKPREHVEVETLMRPRKPDLKKSPAKIVNFVVAKTLPVPLTVYQRVDVGIVRSIHLLDRRVMVNSRGGCQRVSWKVVETYLRISR